MTEYHIVPSGNQWRLQKSGGSVVSNHRKKNPAIKAGQKAVSNGDTLVIHGSNGAVQERRNY